MPEELSFDDEINVRINRVPFEPFVVILASGDRFEIGDGVQVAIGKFTISLYYARSGITVLRKNQIVAIHNP
jgi:hypothetical protein